MIRKPSKARRPRSVSFSGIDGSGKSTQIDALTLRLNELGLRVLLVTFWNDVARLTRMRELTGRVLFKGDRGVGTPTRPIARRDKNVRSWYMTAVRFCLYFLDAISLRMVAEKAFRDDVDVVIFDRYAYDELANLALHRSIVRAYVRLLLRIVPRPDISFLVDADPTQARARKPEYPAEFLRSNRASYLALSELVDLTILAPHPIANVEQQVLQQVLEKLFPPGPQQLPSLSHTSSSTPQ